MPGCSSKNKYVAEHWEITLPEGWRVGTLYPDKYFVPDQGLEVTFGEYIKSKGKITDAELKKKTYLYKKNYKDLKPVSFGGFKGYSYERIDSVYRISWFLVKDNVMVVFNFSTLGTDKREGEKEIKEIENMLKTLKIRK
jgi:hypothetical protein